MNIANFHAESHGRHKLLSGAAGNRREKTGLKELPAEQATSNPEFE